MTWRKWMVRGLVFTTLGLMAAGVVVYQAWTNPEAVRRIVLAKFAARCPGAIVTLQSARMQLFGGIAVSELRLSRKDDPDQAIILYVPSAVIYPDKEQVLNGEMRLRKVELHRPHLHIIRERDGSLNLKGLFTPSADTERVPLLVVRQGTVVVEDRGATPGTPLAEVRDVNLTVVNDPLPVLVVEASGRCDVAGVLRGNAHIQRSDNTLTATVEAPAIPVGPALVQRLAGVCPDLAGHLRQLRGTGRVQASLSYVPGVSQPLHYDVQATLTGGEFAHARLPWALDQVEASAHCADGQVAVATVHGRAGACRVELSLRDLRPPRQGDFVLEDAVREMDWTVEHLAVTPQLFAYLPENLRELDEIYKPSGRVTISHQFRHDADGKCRKSWRLQPESMSGACKFFPYPLHQVTGVVDREMIGDKGGVIRINLAAYAQDRPVTIQGEVLGERGRDGVSIDLHSDNVPIDERLHDALNPYPRMRTIANQFHLRGRVDVQAFVRGAGGAFANRFLLKFHDTSLQYDQFPYPLDHVTGVLEVLPDHWECREVCGHHQGGEMRVAGRGFLPQATAGAAGARLPERMRLSIQGRAVPLDEPFEAALAPPDVPGRGPMRHAFKTLRLSGHMNFDAEVVDRNGNPLDMDVAVAIEGASIRPRFFDYAMDNVSGLVHYANQQVTLTHICAAHGGSQLHLNAGQVILKPGGGFQVYMRPPDGAVTASSKEMRPIEGLALVPDDDLLHALPPGIRRGLETLHLRGPFDVATAMVVTVAEPGALPDVWWDGLAWLDNAALHTGIELTGVKGEVACQGRYNGQQIEGLLGNVYVERMNVLGQPLRDIQTRLEVMRGSPDVLRFRDVKAELFGGTIGGQALVRFGGGSSYELVLEAPAIPMEEFGRHNFGGNAELQGPALVSLYLNGDGSGVNGLHGQGRVEVVNGKMYKLPILLGLLNAFGLRLPDRNAFEQARVHFEINGPQVHVSELELVGNAISLSGQGALNLDGTNLNLDFTATWGRLQQILPTGLNLLPKLVSDQFLKIKVRGKLGDVRYEKELVPGVVEPVKRVLGKS